MLYCICSSTDDDIIEGMEFTTMKVSGAEPMHKMQKLKWDHKVWLDINDDLAVTKNKVHCSSGYLFSV